MFAAAAATYAMFTGGTGLHSLKGNSSLKKSIATAGSPRSKGPTEAGQSGAGGQKRSTPKPKDAAHDSQSVVASIKLRAKAGDLKGAIEIFEKFCAKCNPGSQMNSQVQNCMIDARLQ